MAMDLGTFIREQAAAYRERVFLKDYGADREITFGALETLTDRMAGYFLAAGLRAKDHVALLHPNHSDFILCYLAAVKAGCAVVPVNTVYPPPEIAYILNDSRAAMLITTEDLYPKAAEILSAVPALQQTVIKKTGQTIEEALHSHAGRRERAFPEPCDPADPALLFYTSGTTGRPKGVMITHGNLTFSGPNIARSYGLREGDVTIAALPLVHVFANASPVFGSLSSGGTVVVMERFRTEAVFEAVERYRVTWYPGVPTMFHYLLAGADQNTRDIGSLQMFLSGGASLSVEALRALEAKFGTRVLEVYGLTESTGLVTANPVDGVRKPGSIGVPVPGVETRIVDADDHELGPGQIGELIFRGPNACKGYWNRPEETRQKIRNGWVYTGDHACRDEDGYYTIVGRDKELIITGGYNVYPREIEEVLHRHPDVHEVAVAGVPHAEKGEIPKAFVVKRPGAAADRKALADFCKQHLAPYKVPAVCFLDDLPKNPTGKIMKSELIKTEQDGEP